MKRTKLKKNYALTFIFFILVVFLTYVLYLAVSYNLIKNSLIYLEEDYKKFILEKKIDKSKLKTFLSFYSHYQDELNNLPTFFGLFEKEQMLNYINYRKHLLQSFLYYKDVLDNLEVLKKYAVSICTTPEYAFSREYLRKGLDELELAKNYLKKKMLFNLDIFREKRFIEALENALVSLNSFFDNVCG